MSPLQSVGDTPSDTTTSARTGGPTLGPTLVVAGLLCTAPAVGFALSPDGYIASPRYRAVILALQCVTVLAGVALTLRRPRPVLPRLALVPVIALLALGAWANVRGFRIIDPDHALHAAVDRFVASENVLLARKIDLKHLQRNAQDLRLPGEDSRHYFADTVMFGDLSLPDAAPVSAGLGTSGLRRGEGKGQPAAREVPAAELDAWRDLFSRVDRFESAKFNIVKGDFLDDSRAEWEADVTFDALARTPDGHWESVGLQLDVRWRSDAPERDDARWRIVSWRTRSALVMNVERPAFEEVLGRVLRTPEERSLLRKSVHQKEVLASYLDPDFEPPYPEFSRPALDRHDGVSVADVDGDGDDDIYVMVRRGRNLLLLNGGDGSFAEKAADFGLDLPGDTSSGIFADFDNDGDLDFFAGRTLKPSLLLVNEGGHFADRTAELVAGPMPMLVSSVSAADYDGDGLLDLYVSTYAWELLVREWDARGPLAPKTCLARYLDARDAEALHTLMADPDGHRYRDAPGPPNVLLHNLGGGRFGVVADPGPLRLFRNTYQSTWADIDADGDLDLYCANDFATNALFRNDGGGVFTNVTEQAQAADVGFGMGASFGDYDEDGDQDLYVSNMFSKAGLRVTAAIPGVDPTFRGLARGNSLFRNDGGVFARASGDASPALLVERVGWSYGSQFVDVDNDGDLDIYALSGYETAPKEVEGPIDR